jgi:glycosyltransferase involved in cell wall biosynthesis
MRFAFVSPRYGGDISSGAEHACRLLAERLSARHDVEVLTTAARDARTWKNELGEGVDRVRGVLVRRFNDSQPHDGAAFQQLSDRIFVAPRSRDEEMEWVRRLGPTTPGLIDHLRRHHRSFDALVFFSLVHATTVHGLPIAPERSILFPCLRLGPSLRFALWPDMIASARATGLTSAFERRLLRSFVGVAPAREEIVGIGIEPGHGQAYPRHQQDPADDAAAEDWIDDAEASAPPDDAPVERGVPFRRRHRLYGTFALYGGRVEHDNGCEEMLDYFDTYASAGGDASLVLMGIKMIRVPDEPYLTQAGVLADRERTSAFEAADITIAPGHDDPLALSVLESLAVGTPVLASARNEAAVEHVRKAGGGLYYANREEFVEGLRTLMTRTRLREQLGESGRQYIEQHCRWDAVLGRFERLVGTLKPRG